MIYRKKNLKMSMISHLKMFVRHKNVICIESIRKHPQQRLDNCLVMYTYQLVFYKQ